MSEMISDEKRSNKIGSSRRNLLKILGVSFLGLGLTRVGVNSSMLDPKMPDSDMSDSKENNVMVPEIVHGVRVFGLNKKLDNQTDIDDLNLNIDLDFERKLKKEDRSENVWAQREKLLPRDVRYVEFVVTESAYKSFLDRKEKTGVDYVEWVKLHIDLMNRMSKNAKPKSNMKTQIRRIIVVSDDFKSNPMKYTKDIDAAWFNDTDYRVDQDKETNQGYFWSFKHNGDGSLVFQYPAGGETRLKPDITISHEDDTFEKVRDGVWVDCGLTHELTHQAWNLPDEYAFDTKESPFAFKNFSFYTGSAHEPRISSYLSRLQSLFINLGVRGYYTDPKGIGRAPNLKEKYFHFANIPAEIKLNIEGVSEVELNKCYFPSPDYYSTKQFLNVGHVSADANNVILPKNLFETQMTEKGEMFPVLSMLKFKIGGNWKELFIPLAIFNMAKFVGIEKAICNLKINHDVDVKDLTTLQFEIIDESEIEEYMRIRKERNFLPYATMKIEGLSTWFIWSAQK